ncbi:hypothetical protein [Flavobacterium sp. GT3R68]|uniref:hypothetical protein n=1 Tax=Flavobacterium sp. GT3R68 TaxID=2594437 RepID=UPI000F867248|nr:hypothetical protein [Flavobacterium sp. GT3R68]RTY92408.1 hypothetical protein EKL32_17545 [Flavobacterium sp. GSN2]TRW92324.1 hypothetical protein FNW07_04760 [Flavobacterium sp. GT3R68]
MMKHVRAFLFLALIFAANTITAQSVTEKWPAMHEFHEVMSQTFHPAEEGNLAPIKSRSEEMMKKAAAILKSDIPQEFRTEPVLAEAERLQLKSKDLHNMVITNTPNEAIVKLLTDIHLTFHRIVGLCSDKK